MMTIAYKRLVSEKRPRVSFVLLDWACRESFHSLDYLARQNVPRDSYEILWIEYYERRAAGLDQKLAEYTAKALPAPLDLWTILGMDGNLYYHKHLMYNIGIIQSRGDIVVICDSDAMFPPDFVQTVIATFDSTPNILLHFDEVRNTRQDLYPFSYPSFEEMIGPGVINWRDGKTTGLWDHDDPLHSRNYGACFCARRADLIAIGGADEHLDYLGHVCGPYEMTFRLVNQGVKEIWHDSVFLYHTWHPGSDGEFNYIGPSDGRHMSSTALAAREQGRVMPLLENAGIRALREGRSIDGVPLIDPSYREAWTEDAVSRSPNFTLFKQGPAAPRLVMSFNHYNIVEYDKQFYGVAHEFGPLDMADPEHRALPGIIAGSSVDIVQQLIGAGQTMAADPMASNGGSAPTLNELGSTEKLATVSATGGDTRAAIQTNGDPQYELETTFDPIPSVSANGSLSEFADNLLKFAAESEIDRRARDHRMRRLEEDSRERSDALNQLRTMLTRKDEVIDALQQRVRALEHDAAQWRQHVAHFPAALDLLPLLRRKSIAVDRGKAVFVPASAEPGHFLYGPYLHLEPGAYRLEIQCDVAGNGDDTAPVIAIETVAGTKVVAETALARQALMKTRVIEFSITEQTGNSGVPVEFRLSHFGRTDLNVSKIQLLVGREPVPTSVPTRTYDRSRRSRFRELFRLP